MKLTTDYVSISTLLLEVICVNVTSCVERCSPGVERRTHNRGSPGSNLLCCHFETWTCSFSQRHPSTLRCIPSSGDMRVSSLRATIAAWMNASQRSQVSVGMNRSARGVKCKALRACNGLGTALYKNIPFYYIPLCHFHDTIIWWHTCHCCDVIGHLNDNDYNSLTWNVTLRLLPWRLCTYCSIQSVSATIMMSQTC